MRQRKRILLWNLEGTEDLLEILFDNGKITLGLGCEGGNIDYTELHNIIENLGVNCKNAIQTKCRDCDTPLFEHHEHYIGIYHPPGTNPELTCRKCDWDRMIAQLPKTPSKISPENMACVSACVWSPPDPETYASIRRGEYAH